MKIKKNNLVIVYDFLEKIELAGASSRSRTKLNKQIVEAVKELQEDEISISEENGGEIKENGSVEFPDAHHKKEFEESRSSLREEESIFTENTQGQFENLKNALNDYDEKLSGKEAFAYDVLLDSLEE